MGAEHAAPALESRSLGNQEGPRHQSLAVTLQNAVLRAAGEGPTGGGAAIARIMPQARADNTWRSVTTYWKKWCCFCEVDGISELDGEESSLLRYLGWLFDTKAVSGSSVRNYTSAVCTGHTRVGLSLSLTPLLQLALAAYINADANRKTLLDPALSKERRAFPSTVARQIFRAAMSAASSDLKFIRNATAVLVNLVFFCRGEAGASLLMENIAVSEESVLVAIALRKNQSRVAHTLAYSRNSDFETSLIDLVRRYDSMRRSNRSASKYYWILPGEKHSTSASAITKWLHSCLNKINVQPPPQVSWSSHSLRMAATSECAAIHVEEYRILIWGDWGSARTFRETYLDGRVKACEDSRIFFGHLL